MTNIDQYFLGQGTAYGTYLTDVISHFRDSGINITLVSPMNEPDSSFVSCPLLDTTTKVVIHFIGTISLWARRHVRASIEVCGVRHIAPFSLFSPLAAALKLSTAFTLP
jgi:hypothetical protein